MAVLCAVKGGHGQLQLLGLLSLRPDSALPRDSRSLYGLCILLLLLLLLLISDASGMPCDNNLPATVLGMLHPAVEWGLGYQPSTSQGSAAAALPPPPMNPTAAGTAAEHHEAGKHVVVKQGDSNSRLTGMQLLSVAASGGVEVFHVSFMLTGWPSHQLAPRAASSTVLS